MVTLEQKIDLVMQYIVEKDTKEKNRLKNEIAAVLSDPSTTSESTPDISSIIDDLFKELGAPCHLMGYSRAAYAIELVISDPEYIDNVTSRLYVDVAKKFNKTSAQTERAIRHLIEVMWNRQDLNAAFRIFGNTIDPVRAKPTNSEFIARCAKVIERRMQECVC